MITGVILRDITNVLILYSLINVIEIKFLLNITYSIFITMHKVLKGKKKHESLKTRTMRPFFSYAFVSSFETHSVAFESFCT